MSNLSLRHECLLLDACCAINLYSSGQMGPILASLSVPAAISEYVYSVEVIVGNAELNTEAGAGPAITLQSLRDTGLLGVIGLTASEEIDAVNFSSVIDGGEAFTCAIAKNRDCAVATDDKRAISFLSATVPQLQIVTTPQLIKHWAEVGQVREEIVQDILRRVHALGRYLPPKDHPLYEWWHRSIAEVPSW